jgi:hypothetical protein
LLEVLSKRRIDELYEILFYFLITKINAVLCADIEMVDFPRN